MDRKLCLVPLVSARGEVSATKAGAYALSELNDIKVSTRLAIHRNDETGVLNIDFLLKS